MDRKLSVVKDIAKKKGIKNRIYRENKKEINKMNNSII